MYEDVEFSNELSIIVSIYLLCLRKLLRNS